ncbi:MAG: hypothetical protein ACSHX0_12330 [Akkermansiaceae bacterium]
MTRLKKHIVYTFLAVFVFSAITGLSGLIGLFDIQNEGVRWLFGLLIAQCATVIVAIIKAPEYFTEPEAITKLQEEHFSVVAALQDELARCLKDRESTMSWVGTKIMPDDSAHPLYEWIKQRNTELKDDPESELEPQKSQRRF